MAVARSEYRNNDLTRVLVMKKQLIVPIVTMKAIEHRHLLLPVSLIVCRVNIDDYPSAIL